MSCAHLHFIVSLYSAVSSHGGWDARFACTPSVLDKHQLPRHAVIRTPRSPLVNRSLKSLQVTDNMVVGLSCDFVLSVSPRSAASTRESAVFASVALPCRMDVVRPVGAVVGLVLRSGRTRRCPEEGVSTW